MTNRTRWPAWLVTVLVVALAATWWWWPTPDDAIVSTRIPPIAAAPAAAIAPAPIPVAIPAAPKPAHTALSASAFRLVGTVVAANRADSFALVRRTANSQLVQ